MNKLILSIAAACICSGLMSSTAFAARAWGYWTCSLEIGNEVVHIRTPPQLFTYETPPETVLDPSADYMDQILAESERDIDNWATFSESQPGEQKRFLSYMEELYGQACAGTNASIPVLSPPYETAAEAAKNQEASDLRNMTDASFEEVFGMKSRYEMVEWPLE